MENKQNNSNSNKSLGKRTGDDKENLSDYPDGNLDANSQNDGIRDDQNKKPQGKSVDEATDPSKLSQL